MLPTPHPLNLLLPVLMNPRIKESKPPEPLMRNLSRKKAVAEAIFATKGETETSHVSSATSAVINVINVTSVTSVTSATSAAIAAINVSSATSATIAAINVSNATIAICVAISVTSVKHVTIAASSMTTETGTYKRSPRSAGRWTNTILRD